jgi:hypothetical protein
MSLDFENDIVPRIHFLHDQGIQADDLGQIFSKNPDFFTIDLGNFNYFDRKFGMLHSTLDVGCHNVGPYLL